METLGRPAAPARPPNHTKINLTKSADQPGQSTDRGLGAAKILALVVSPRLEDQQQTLDERNDARAIGLDRVDVQFAAALAAQDGARSVGPYLAR